MPHARVEVADVHDLPFADASFDAVLMFHTLTYAERPARALEECARVLRPGGRLVLLCLDEHDHREVSLRFGERHPGFSPRALRKLLARTDLQRAVFRGRVSRGQETVPARRAGDRREAGARRSSNEA